MDGSSLFGPAIGALIAIGGILVNNHLSHRRERAVRLWDVRRVAYSTILHNLKQLRHVYASMLDYAIEDEQRCTYGSAYTDLEKKALELRACLSQTYGESVLIISREFSSAFERLDNNAARGDDRTLNDRLLHLVEACDRGAAELRAAALSDLEV